MNSRHFSTYVQPQAVVAETSLCLGKAGRPIPPAGGKHLGAVLKLSHAFTEAAVSPGTPLTRAHEMPAHCPTLGHHPTRCTAHLTGNKKYIINFAASENVIPSSWHLPQQKT